MSFNDEPTFRGNFDQRFFWDRFSSRALDLACYTIDHYVPSIDTADDFSYVRDGTWCGLNSFCHDRRCLHISEIPGITSCPSNCFGNGFCNSSSQCECQPTFLPPDCQHSATAIYEENSSLVESTLSPVKLGTIAAVLAVIAVVGGIIFVQTCWVKVQKQNFRYGSKPTPVNPIVQESYQNIGE